VSEQIVIAKTVQFDPSSFLEKAAATAFHQIIDKVLNCPAPPPCECAPCDPPQEDNPIFGLLQKAALVVGGAAVNYTYNCCRRRFRSHRSRRTHQDNVQPATSVPATTLASDDVPWVRLGQRTVGLQSHCTYETRDGGASGKFKFLGSGADRYFEVQH
jgi:hypothetical protein